MPDPEEKTASANGYNLTYYPGFLRLCTVKDAAGTETKLFEQKGRYDLPSGQKKPKTNYRIHFDGGAKKQDLTLNVHDPSLRIKKITIELYGDDYEPGSGKDAKTEDTVMLMNGATTCPPDCPT